MIKKTILTILFLSIFTSVFAKDITLEWDINDDADYYIVYWGLNSGDYNQNSENVTQTRYTVVNLLEEQTYYFAVKAFNSCGNSSDFSDEVISENTCPKLIGVIENMKIVSFYLNE